MGTTEEKLLETTSKKGLINLCTVRRRQLEEKEKELEQYAGQIKILESILESEKSILKIRTKERDDTLDAVKESEQNNHRNETIINGLHKAIEVLKEEKTEVIDLLHHWIHGDNMRNESIRFLREYGDKTIFK